MRSVFYGAQVPRKNRFNFITAPVGAGTLRGFGSGGVLYFVFKKIFIDTKLEEHHNGY